MHPIRGPHSLQQKGDIWTRATTWWTQAAKEVSSRKRKEAEKVETGITERGQYDWKKRRDSAVDEEEESAGVVRTGDEVEGGARRERSGLATSCTITEKMGRRMEWESY